MKTIALPAHPEGFRIDPGKKRAFVNLPNAREVAVLDVASGKSIAEWKAAHLMNFPMAIDPAAGILAIVYRWPARLDLVDEATGRVRQDMPTCGDADDVYFDPPRGRIYVSCGSGEVDVLQKAAGRYTHVTGISTRGGARTALFLPELDRLIVAEHSRFGTSAALAVFRPAN